MNRQSHARWQRTSPMQELSPSTSEAGVVASPSPSVVCTVWIVHTDVLPSPHA